MRNHLSMVIFLAVFANIIIFSGCTSQSVTLKPIKPGFLDPVSKLKKARLHLQESIEYAILYHNAFLKKNSPLAIKTLEVKDGVLNVEIAQAGTVYSFRSGSAGFPGDTLREVFQQIVKASPDTPGPIDEQEIRDIDALLSSCDEFAYVTAIRRIENQLRHSETPHPWYLAKAAEAYANLALVSRRGYTSSFALDMVSRALALNTLASLLNPVNPPDYACTGAVLSYTVGNVKRANDLASLPAAQTDLRCKSLTSLSRKDPDTSAEASTAAFWNIVLSGVDASWSRKKLLQSLYARAPRNLFILASLSNSGVGEGRTYGPALVNATIRGHLDLIQRLYPAWAEKAPHSRKLFGQTWYQRLGVRLYVLIRNMLAEYPLVDKIFNDYLPVPVKKEGEPAWGFLEMLNEAFFRDGQATASFSPELFPERDEAALFYNDLMAALAQWHYLLTDQWGVFDYAQDAAEHLNRIFEHDAVVRYLYARALSVNGKARDAFKTQWEISQAVGDRGLLLKVLDHQEFVRNNPALTKDLVETFYGQFPENGTLCNHLGKIVLPIDGALRRKLLAEAIKNSPWDIEAVYFFSWDTNDFGPMKRLIDDLPESAQAHYYAGLLAYMRMASVPMAVDLLRKAVQLDPAMYTASEELGRLLEIQGKADEAADVYRSYIKTDPDSLSAVEIEGKIGYLLLKQGKPRDALAIFSRTAESYKFSAIKGAVLSYQQAGDAAAAEAWAQRLVERYPGYKSTTVLCKLYYRTSQMDKLAETISRYAKANGQYAPAMLSGWQARTSKRERFAGNFGALIYEVLANGMAQRLGLHAGDIILSYRGKPVDSGQDMENLRFPFDEQVEMTVARGDEILTYQFKSRMLDVYYEY